MNELLSIVKICVRENFTSQPNNQRINEPTMAMTMEEQVKGFEIASAFNGPLAPLQCFAAYNASRAIRNATKILDLGCGTGHVITKMAYMNPDKKFIALDLSEGMLEQAEKLAKKMNLTNIEFHLGDMTDLSKFIDQRIDAVTSSLALHHLRSEEDLNKTFVEVKKLLGNTGAFSFYDVGRLKFKRSIDDLISMHNNHTPVYIEDTINSFLAAFMKTDFDNALKVSGLSERANLKTTMIVPNFIKANSKLEPLSKNQRQRLSSLLGGLNFSNKFLFYVLRGYFLE